MYSQIKRLQKDFDFLNLDDFYSITVTPNSFSFQGELETLCRSGFFMFQHSMLNSGWNERSWCSEDTVMTYFVYEKVIKKMNVRITLSTVSPVFYRGKKTTEQQSPGEVEKK